MAMPEWACVLCTDCLPKELLFNPIFHLIFYSCPDPPFLPFI